MIDALPHNDYVVTKSGRLSADVVEPALAVIERELGFGQSAPGAMMVRRLHRLVDACAPARSLDGPQLGVLPEILGTVLTLQYPLEQLERFLAGDHCDIDGEKRATLYLSFVRYHLWKLEQLIRELGASRS